MSADGSNIAGPLLQKVRNGWLAGVMLLTFGVALLATPGMGGGWFWSIGNGLGLAALAGMIYLSFDSRKGGKIRAHQLVSYCVAGLLLAHVFWFLVGDKAALEYAKIGAPWSMWSAWLALFLLVFLIVTSLPGVRQKHHSGHSEFRNWHRLLTIAVFVTTMHHLAGSSFYLRTYWQLGLMTLLLAAAVFLPVRKVRQFVTSSPMTVLAISLVLVIVFACIGNLEL
jgi:drug/metabolite transporter (DMT)-like permease